MNMRKYEQNGDFNHEAVRALLLDISVSPETGERLGVSAASLEGWVHALADSLGDGSRREPGGRSAARPVTGPEGRQLSQLEIHFLLNGCEAAPALEN